jgi:hypothetical protein
MLGIYNGSMMASFSLESGKCAKKENTFTVLRENNHQPRIPLPVEIFFKNKDIYRQSKTKRIYCQRTCTVRNAEVSSLG